MGNYCKRKQLQFMDQLNMEKKLSKCILSSFKFSPTEQKHRLRLKQDVFKIVIKKISIEKSESKDVDRSLTEAVVVPELNQLLTQLCRGEVLQNCLEGKAESNNNLFTIKNILEIGVMFEFVYTQLFCLKSKLK